ncbi:fatty-acyl-CoA synthase [Stella humosa]|uniref:Long-chain-fatty-acid--CoA ligase n=1 Tax=Stella humosa TaxID=94 RepID=A0A3N1L1Z1_9PROT|nr:AMP-binding protein [Stella humosa]ROP83535.1 fatty-acyl-CoA synthase [Stella humosa]BBK33192.1 fatty acid CoA ligase [Stella humosa]
MTAATMMITDAAPTLGRFLDTVAERHAGRTAWWYGDRSGTFADMALASRRVAGGLARLGIGRGDRVMLWLPNGPAWLAFFFGAARLGAIVFCANTRFRQREMADLVGRGGVKAICLWPGFKDIGFLDILAAADPAAFSRVESVILHDEGEPVPPLPAALAHARRQSFADLAAAPPWTGDVDDAGAGAAVFTTSGTTKAPKFVLHPHRSLTAHAAQSAAAMGYFVPGQATLQSLPFCGVFGFCQVMASLAAAAPMAIQPFFEPEAAVAAIARHRLTATNATDDMLERMLAADPSGRRLASLGRCGFAAFKAPERRDLVDAFDRFGTRLHGLYGMSEVQALYAMRGLDDAAGRRVLAGGMPVAPGGRVRVVAADGEGAGERALPDGEAGLLETSGPSLMAEYLDNPAATAEALTADGFLRTGDIGYREPDGSFVYLTRAGDVMRLGGFLVAPREIEAFLEDEAGIVQAQVVAADTPAGPRAVGFVILAPGAILDEAAVQARGRAVLARYKVPARIFAVDAFPTTESANGMKIQRARLREEATRRLAADA